MRKTCLFILLIYSTVISAKNTSVNSIKHSPSSRSQTGCTEPTAMVDLNINNVRARIFSGGDMWWNLVTGAGTSAQYEVPKGSGINSMFAGSIWVGGYDVSGNLKVAGQTYRQNGNTDYYSGPVSTLSGTPDASVTTCNTYDKIWKVTSSSVVNFINNGVTTPDILSWPGNGDIANGELPQLAPYEDVNGDGLYNTVDGDYPKYNISSIYPIDTLSGVLSCDDYIFGHQTLWWVFNDVGNLKTETNSAAIGLEIRAQAFSYATATGINNCTFYKYQIINRSSSILDSAYIGIWSDPDLGDGSDDFVGCDTMLGLGYCYNSTNNDVGLYGYGVNPPAVGIDILQGPLADVNDGIDNDKDGVTDEPGEQIFMSRFMYYNSNSSSAYGDPSTMDDYYQYLSGSWKNGNHWTKDYAQGTTPPGNGFPITNYIYSGDPVGGSGWSEISAGNSGSDKRGVMSAGEFSMQPGEVNHVSTSVVWARSSISNLASITALKTLDNTVQNLFNSCFNGTAVGINDINKRTEAICFPNPMNRITTITATDKKGTLLTLTIYNSKGVIVEKQITKTGVFTVQKKSKTAGVYFYEVLDEKVFKQSGKLVVE